ncbi:MAG: AAA family ATPase [Fibrobacteres bacterium]|nr:AAA family ATPase [Fibrobacterota bacterium]
MDINTLIPKETDFTIPKGREREFEILSNSILSGENILLRGEPGCGKSAYVLHLAAKHKVPVIQIQGDGDMGVVDIVGGFQYSSLKNGTYWIDGALSFALRNGCWVLFDEINMTLPEVLARLHSVLDHRRHLDLKETGESIIRSSGTAFIGTMNPDDFGVHSGTKPLSPALFSRFDIIMDFDYLSGNEEVKLLMKTSDISLKDAQTMVSIAEKSREARKNLEMSLSIDTRMLIAWSKKAVQYGLKDSARAVLVSRFSDADKAALRGILVGFGLIDLVKKGSQK